MLKNQTDERIPISNGSKDDSRPQILNRISTGTYESMSSILPQHNITATSGPELQTIHQPTSPLQSFHRYPSHPIQTFNRINELDFELQTDAPDFEDGLDFNIFNDEDEEINLELSMDDSSIIWDIRQLFDVEFMSRGVNSPYPRGDSSDIPNEIRTVVTPAEGSGCPDANNANISQIFCQINQSNINDDGRRSNTCLKSLTRAIHDSDQVKNILFSTPVKPPSNLTNNNSSSLLSRNFLVDENYTSESYKAHDLNPASHIVNDMAPRVSFNKPTKSKYRKKKHYYDSSSSSSSNSSSSQSSSSSSSLSSKHRRSHRRKHRQKKHQQHRKFYPPPFHQPGCMLNRHCCPNSCNKPPNPPIKAAAEEPEIKPTPIIPYYPYQPLPPNNLYYPQPIPYGDYEQKDILQPQVPPYHLPINFVPVPQFSTPITQESPPTDMSDIIQRINRLNVSIENNLNLKSPLSTIHEEQFNNSINSSNASSMNSNFANPHHFQSENQHSYNNYFRSY